MINWFSLAANALWIIGCALGLAAISYANWEAAMCGERLRVRLKQPRIQIAINAAGILFCLGLAATGRTWWEQALWGLLAVAWVVQVWLTGPWRETSSSPRRELGERSVETRSAEGQGTKGTVGGGNDH